MQAPVGDPAQHVSQGSAHTAVRPWETGKWPQGPEGLGEGKAQNPTSTPHGREAAPVTPGGLPRAGRTEGFLPEILYLGGVGEAWGTEPGRRWLSPVEARRWAPAGYLLSPWSSGFSFVRDKYLSASLTPSLFTFLLPHRENSENSVESGVAGLGSEFPGYQS